MEKFTQTCGNCGNQEPGPWVECSVCGWVPPEEREENMTEKEDEGGDELFGYEKERQREKEYRRGNDWLKRHGHL